jgi:hypothetical protein
VIPEIPEIPAVPVAEALRRRFERQGVAVQVVETHISWVLLAGDFAYKIKKPVRLGFLDFSSLDARRHCCEEELRLNRRLAAFLYLGLRPVLATADGPALQGEGGDEVKGPVIDYAIQMRRLPPGSLASEHLAAGLLEARHLSRFAERLAAFQRDAPVAAPASGFGTPARVQSDLRGVADGLEALHIALPPGLRAWLETQSQRLAGRWQRRLDEGWVREGHGDLHLDNLIVLGEDVTAFDCIEFDPAMRWIDVISDVAFLVMDLLARGRTDLAFGFLNAWLECSGDYGGLPLLRVYLVQRALVRALVAGLRERDRLVGSGPSVAGYLGLAAAWAGAGSPRLLITHGLPGSGKSHVSQRLLEVAGAVRVRSDVERKRGAGLAMRERSAPAARPALYGPAATEATYERLAWAACEALDGGFPVIVDAAFLRRAERERFHALALERRLPFHILDCQAPMDRLRERVRQRAERGADPSEADEPVLELLAHTQEPLDAAEQAHALMVQTGEPLDSPALMRRWWGCEMP